MRDAVNVPLRPEPVAVLSAERVGDDFDARHSARARHYLYRIVNRRAPLTLEKNRAWLLSPDCDAEAMHRAAQSLVGHHDFTTFRSVHCQAASPVKTLDRLDVRRHGDEIRIEVAARSFLHHQVRSMVGCLALVGMGRWKESRIAQVLEAKDRQELGLNAPSHGLYFVEAIYPETP